MRIVRHKKRGTQYEVVGVAELQTATDLVDGSEMMVYRGTDGRLWVRPVDEFEDGRFEDVPPKPLPTEIIRVMAGRQAIVWNWLTSRWEDALDEEPAPESRIRHIGRFEDMT